VQGIDGRDQCHSTICTQRAVNILQQSVPFMLIQVANGMTDCPSTKSCFHAA
jgi:hypothetical protein